MATSNLKQFLASRRGFALSGGLALVAAWLVGLQATSSGSWLQYGVLIILGVYGIDHIIRAVIRKST